MALAALRGREQWLFKIVTERCAVEVESGHAKPASDSATDLVFVSACLRGRPLHEQPSSRFAQGQQ